LSQYALLIHTMFIFSDCSGLAQIQDMILYTNLKEGTINNNDDRFLLHGGKIRALDQIIQHQFHLLILLQ
jgi:hypothetical protein